MDRLRHAPDRSISNYLVEEILNRQTPAVQDFLVQTSIVNQFSLELCLALLGRDDSLGQVQTTLDWLEGSNLFLVPLDDRQGWYRFHHLFQQLLQRQLHIQYSEDEIVVLHKRASVWYAEQGLIEQAIEHALAAGYTLGAVYLVEAQFFEAFEQEQLVQMDRLLPLLSEEQIQGSPVLLIAKMWILQAHGQLKDFPQLLTAAEQLLATHSRGISDNQQPRVLHALIATLRSQYQFFSGQARESLESAHSALEWLPQREEYIASFVRMFQAWSNQAMGNENIALIALQESLSDHSSQINSAARLLFAQAAVYLIAGKLHQVEHTARHLLQTAQKGDLALSQTFAHWFLGVVYYEQNNLDAASFHFSAVIANQHHAHFWMVEEAIRGLALAYQAQGLGIQAQENARSLLELVQEQHNMQELMTAYSFQGQLAPLRDELETAEQWIEMTGKQGVLGPMIFFEDSPISKVRLLLAKGDDASVCQGQVLLTKLLQHVETIHSTRKTIQVLALQAWAYDLQKFDTEALDVLERALTLARPAGFIRTFADLPPLAKLLHELRKRRKTDQTIDKNLDTYLQQLLSAMNHTVSQTSTKEALPHQEGLEPLTSRELEILRLLDKDLSNKEIARELVVTPGTVKVHTNHVYRKLSVNNRRAAVTLAKALGFLAVDKTFMPQWRYSS